MKCNVKDNLVPKILRKLISARDLSKALNKYSNMT